MARLTWSPNALKDLDDICTYIGKSSESYARVLARQVIALAESVPEFPRLGPRVEEWDNDDVRERLCQNYRVIYRLREEDVEIITIVHGAKRLPRTPPA